METPVAVDGKGGESGFPLVSGRRYLLFVLSLTPLPSPSREDRAIILGY